MSNPDSRNEVSASQPWHHFAMAIIALLLALAAVPIASSCGADDLIINGNPPVRTRTILVGTQTPDPNDAAQ